MVFDKDNTITVPYIKQIHPKIQPGIDEVTRVFQEDFAILSNSAGSSDDPGYKEAESLEKDLGIYVI